MNMPKSKRDAALAVRNMMGDLQGLLDEHAEVDYQIKQVESSIGDLLYLADQARVRYQENTAEIIDHLIGNQSGNVLHRNAYVQDASNSFDELIRTAYKMVMAMGHTYNLKGAPQPHNLETLINRLYQMLTPGDVADFIAELDFHVRSPKLGFQRLRKSIHEYHNAHRWLNGKVLVLWSF